jgi:hypothetical protein
MESAWVRIASSARAFVDGPPAKVCTLEAVRTQALSQGGCENPTRKGTLTLLLKEASE